MKKKHMLMTAAAVLTAAAVGTLSVGVTQALLTARSRTLVNHINIKGDGVSALLLEPQWDGIRDFRKIGVNVYPVYEYRSDSGTTKPVYGYVDGKYESPVYSAGDPGTGIKPEKNSAGDPVTYGIDSAKDMIPGASAQKDPYIVNTSAEMPVWAAARVTFVYAGAEGANGLYASKKGMPLDIPDMLTLYDIIDIDYNCDAASATWERIDQELGDARDVSAADPIQTFYYKSKLAAGGTTTSPLFTKVTIKNTASAEDIKFLKNIGGFAVYVEGFAVQADKLPDGYGEFKTWGTNGGVFFSNTPTTQKPISFDETGIIP